MNLNAEFRMQNEELRVTRSEAFFILNSAFCILHLLLEVAR